MYHFVGFSDITADHTAVPHGRVVRNLVVLSPSFVLALLLALSSIDQYSLRRSIYMFHGETKSGYLRILWLSIVNTNVVLLFMYHLVRIRPVQRDSIL